MLHKTKSKAAVKSAIEVHDIARFNGVHYAVTDISRDRKYARIECRQRGLVDVRELSELVLV